MSELNDKEFIARASPIILLIAGTSGAGKSTLAKYLLAKYPDSFINLVRSTTRPPRKDEARGEPLRFLSEDQFNRFKAGGEIYFQNDRFGYQYGFHAESVKQAIRSGKIIIIEGWKSANLMRKFWPAAKIFTMAVLPVVIEGQELRGSKREEVIKFLQGRIYERDPDTSEDEINERARQTLNEIIDIQKIADKVLINPAGTDLPSLFAQLDRWVESNIFSDLEQRTEDLTN